ncbi:glycosyltransferase family 39 protein [Streptomyces sp. NBC_00249]|uniref:glycosyltransferase family 39 protein n=1 Tax=Streptomyces sp. NBC_00249 TaxID=2975690 RepID=UPI00225A5711|nr:glycosyltransferase family 39 protein [Streptomyces sp. NBC_00249]MCX5198843.1 glycosyltransferase family 39 protein [Streptomyces sp. NBC_00249]
MPTATQTPSAVAPARAAGRRVPGPDWLWAALLTLAVTTFRAGTPQLWRDELASWNAASRGTGDLIAMLGHVDAVSGLYYLLLHGWVAVFGDSAAMLRLPSALAMAGTAALTVVIARRLFDRRTAVFAGLLFALLPAVTRYGTEARSYAFVMLAVTAATWLLLRALDRPRPARWAAYALLVAVSGLLHMVALLFLLPHALIAAMRWWRDRRGRTAVSFAVAVAVGLLPVVPLVLLGRSQVGRQISWIRTPRMRDIAGLWDNLFGSPLVALGIAALALLPLAWSRGRRPAVELLLCGAVPIVAVYLVSQGSTSYFIDRYVLFTLPAWAVLAAAGAAALKPRPAGAAALAALILLGLPDQRQLRTERAKETADGRAAAKIIAEGYRPGDGFVPLRGGEERVYMTDFQVEYYLPDRVRPRDVFAERSAVASDDLFPVECARPEQCLGDTRRIWLVTRDTAKKDPYGKLPADQTAALKSHYKIAEARHVRGLYVTLLERTS